MDAGATLAGGVANSTVPKRVRFGDATAVMSGKAARKRREQASNDVTATRSSKPKSSARRVETQPSPVPFALVACFFLSGAASLMLEVVWTRLLRLVFGSTTLAVSTILVAYMLGLGLGGLAGGRIASRLRRGVATYGAMEIAIGLYALLVPTIVGFFPALNRSLLSSMSFWPAALVRFAISLVVLLPPTVLMGATLPVVLAAVSRRPGHVGTRVGLLYGVNTLGAVSGVLATTFVFFPLIGVTHTNFLAAAVDLTVGAIAVLRLARRFDTGSLSAAHEVARSVAPVRIDVALAAYGVVGFTALVYEVCWTRALSMILGSSIYAFATMLAAFLTGISLGSLIGRRWFDRVRAPFAAYAFGLAALGLSSLLTVAAFGQLPTCSSNCICASGRRRPV